MKPAESFGIPHILAELRHSGVSASGKFSFSHSWQLLKPGDWLVLLLAFSGVVASFPVFWRGGDAERAVIRRDGQIIAEFPLNTARRYAVNGAIGVTQIEMQPGRARVVSDPGVRQYCVQQGWLTQANAVAICAPNHVSLQLTGKAPAGSHDYDSLNY